MFTKSIEYRVIVACPVPTGLQIILYGNEDFSFQWDSSEFLPLAYNIDDSLIPVGLEIPNFQVAVFGFS
jgi:hypothetical protein